MQRNYCRKTLQGVRSWSLESLDQFNLAAILDSNMATFFLLIIRFLDINNIWFASKIRWFGGLYREKLAFSDLYGGHLEFQDGCHFFFCHNLIAWYQKHIVCHQNQLIWRSVTRYIGIFSFEKVAIFNPRWPPNYTFFGKGVLIFSR